SQGRAHEAVRRDRALVLALGGGCLHGDTGMARDRARARDRDPAAPVRADRGRRVQARDGASLSHDRIADLGIHRARRILHRAARALRGRAERARGNPGKDRMISIRTLAGTLAMYAALLGASPPAVADPAPTAPASAAPAPTRITPAAPGADSIPHVADSTLVRNLTRGGYIIFFRHAMTNWNERDGTEGDFSDRAKQRNLSEAGRTQAAHLGKAIAALKIPIERVLASPMWRCRDTAQLAFGAYDTTIMLFWKGPTFREARIKMLGTPPPAGKNLVLVGHQDQLIPIVPGLNRDQLKDGDALAFRPLCEQKYRVVTQITPADCDRLADIPAAPAERVTLVGSTSPASNRSSNFSVSTLKPTVFFSLRACSTTTEPSRPALFTI